MTGAAFVDTNVLVYARDASEPEKQARAEAWLQHLWRTRSGRVSTQVLHEYYVTTTRKLTPGLKKEAARKHVRALGAWRPVVMDLNVLEAAFAVESRHRLSWWEALIVGAAQTAGCRYLLSEDLGDGQRLGGVEVVDPFARSFETLA